MNRVLSTAVTIVIVCCIGLALSGCRVDLDRSDTHTSTDVRPSR